MLRRPFDILGCFAAAISLVVVFGCEPVKIETLPSRPIKNESIENERGKSEPEKNEPPSAPRAAARKQEIEHLKASLQLHQATNEKFTAMVVLAGKPEELAQAKADLIATLTRCETEAAQVSDETLDAIHSEMKTEFKDHFRAGHALMIEGFTTGDKPKTFAGARLANLFHKWAGKNQQRINERTAEWSN